MLMAEFRIFSNCIKRHIDLVISSVIKSVWEFALLFHTTFMNAMEQARLQDLVENIFVRYCKYRFKKNDCEKIANKNSITQ